MILDAGAAAEWSLYWTSRGRPMSARLAPVLTGWADLDQREDAADIGPGHQLFGRVNSGQIQRVVMARQLLK